MARGCKQEQMQAHETAMIHPGAEIGKSVKIGAHSIIEENTIIGDGTEIQTGVVVKSGTRIGRNCRIHHGAVLGDAPQDIKYRGEPTFLTIGEGNVIREYATLHRAEGEGNETVIGDRNMLMAQTHVAHNCRLGNDINMANLATLGGHVHVGDRAFLGGMIAVHQFVHVGVLAMVGGGSVLLEDAPPYMTVAGGYRPPVCGLNTIGLLRAELPSRSRSELKKAYRLLFKSGLSVQNAVDRIKSELAPVPEVLELIGFIEQSERGICKGE